MRRFVVFITLLFVSLQLFSQEVNRVVSLAPSITDNIYLVGGENKLVGCTSYCIPAINDGKEQVGSAINVNVEKIFSLRPDLVLTTGLTKPQDISALKKLGIRVEVMETPKSFDQICEQTLQIARFVGSGKNAVEIVEDAKQKVAEIKEKSKGLKPEKVLFQIGASPVFVAIKNTFLDDYITFCNSENMAGELTSGSMSRESVVLKNPDVIIIAEMGGFGKEEKKVWERYSSVSAVQKKKIFLISSETSCSPSPVNFVSALEDVYKFITQ